MAGVAGDAAHELTFSTLQYAARLCGKNRTYERLVVDFEAAPFVFAGTTLDEVVQATIAEVADQLWDRPLQKRVACGRGDHR